MIELRLLGALDIASEAHPGAPDLLAKPSPTALLTYLAVAAPGCYHRRDHLTNLFWPETPQSQARANLRKLVHTIRACLDSGTVEARGDEEIRLCPEQVWCDAAEFQDAMRSNRPSRAMALYRGELLPGFFLEGAHEWLRWLDETRRSFARDAGKAAVRLADEHLRNAERTEASDLAQFIARIGSHVEDEYLFRKLIKLLTQLGDHAGALKMYDVFRDRLEKEYGAQPAPETRELMELIRKR